MRKKLPTLVEKIQSALAKKEIAQRNLDDAQAAYHKLLSKHEGEKLVMCNMGYTIVSRGGGRFALRPMVSKKTLQALRVQGIISLEDET